MRGGLGAGAGAAVGFGVAAPGGPDAAGGFAAGFGGRSAVALLTKVAPAWTARRALRAADLTRDLTRDFLDEAWFTEGFCTRPAHF